MEVLGAGNETCTRRVSRCFPNSFFAEVLSEELVFRLRQQDRPKSSTGVHRPTLSTPDPHSSQRRQRRSRTGRLCPALGTRTATAMTSRSTLSVLAPFGCQLRATCTAHCVARPRKSCRKNAHPSRGASARDSLSLYQDAGQASQAGGSPRPCGRRAAIASPSRLVKPLAYQAIPRRFCRGRNFLRP